MDDLLWRGDSLDRMSTMSSALRDESLKYRKAARKINIDALIRKWAPLGAVGLMLFAVVYYKFVRSSSLRAGRLTHAVLVGDRCYNARFMYKLTAFNLVSGYHWRADALVGARPQA